MKESAFINLTTLSELVNESQEQYKENKKDVQYQLAVGEIDYDLLLIEAEKSIAKILNSAMEDVLFIGSPLADDSLTLDEEFLKIFADLIGEPDGEGPKWEEGSMFAEVNAPYDYAGYYLFDVKGTPVVMVDGSDGPYIYLTKSGLADLRKS